MKHSIRRNLERYLPNIWNDVRPFAETQALHQKRSLYLSLIFLTRSPSHHCGINAHFPHQGNPKLTVITRFGLISETIVSCRSDDGDEGFFSASDTGSHRIRGRTRKNTGGFRSSHDVIYLASKYHTGRQ